VLLRRVGGGGRGLCDDGECVSGREPRSTGGGGAIGLLILSEVSGRVRSGGGDGGALW